jgi:hypothetical protein
MRMTGNERKGKRKRRDKEDARLGRRKIRQRRDEEERQ